MDTYKISLKTALLILMGFIIQGLHAQQNPDPQILVGTWTFSDAPSIAKMPPDIQLDLTTSSDLQSHVANFYTGRQLLFEANGTFSIVLITGQRFDGQWSLQGSTLTIVGNDGSVTSHQVGAVDSTTLLLLAEVGSNPDSRPLFPELYYLKN
ncbi:hypothetical protein [Flagellimonas sp. S3867]|uniref:hypothetical protein n=1 Tax=Flagellimonas sp. S3867 TaxID=2768063 RepID=UPI001687B149|nr:hypothetical protein [Flagellimonas sp. S3867]